MKPKQQLQLEVIKNVQNNLNLSTNQTLKLNNNRNAVTNNLKSKLHNRSHLLDQFFETKSLTFEITKNNNEKIFVPRNAVICTNTVKLLDYIYKERNYNCCHNHVKIGIDGGGGFL